MPSHASVSHTNLSLPRSCAAPSSLSASHTFSSLLSPPPEPLVVSPLLAFVTAVFLSRVFLHQLSAHLRHRAFLSGAVFVSPSLTFVAVHSYPVPSSSASLACYTSNGATKGQGERKATKEQQRPQAQALPQAQFQAAREDFEEAGHDCNLETAAKRCDSSRATKSQSSPQGQPQAFCSFSYSRRGIRP